MTTKTICDICGDDIIQGKGEAFLRGITSPVDVGGVGGERFIFRVTLSVADTAGPDGKHVDVCPDCRAYLFDRLDPRTEDERFLSFETAQADATMEREQKETNEENEL